MTGICVLNIMSLQKLDIELGVMPDFRPFLCLHDTSVLILYHKPAIIVLQNIAQFAESNIGYTFMEMKTKRTHIGQDHPVPKATLTFWA